MKLEVEQVTIPNGAAVSNRIDLRSRVLRAIVVPSAWTAADIAFTASPDDTVGYVPIVDWDGIPWACTAVASSYLTPRPEVGQAVAFVKIHSVSTADNTVDVNQGAARTITLLTSVRET